MRSCLFPDSNARYPCVFGHALLSYQRGSHLRRGRTLYLDENTTPFSHYGEYSYLADMRCSGTIHRCTCARSPQLAVLDRQMSVRQALILCRCRGSPDRRLRKCELRLHRLKKVFRSQLCACRHQNATDGPSQKRSSNEEISDLIDSAAKC